MNRIDGFEHIHLHTAVGSLLDGLGQPEEYGEKWKSHGKYLSISDHGMMAAIPRQVKTCDKNSLTPIYSCELYCNPLQIEYSSEKELKSYMKTLDPEDQKRMRKSYHLLAVAYTDEGYSNLVTLSSLAWIKGFYYRPRVNHQQLMKYKDGIIFTSCCYASEVGQAFDQGREDAGFAMIEKYMAMFGQNYYLELMMLDFAKQKPYDKFIIKAHDKYKIPLILTQDVHYCNANDAKYQRYMLMVQTKKTIKEIEQKIQDAGEQDLFELQDTNLWMKTEEELNEKWEKDYKDIIDYDLFVQAKKNTVEICRKAGNVKLDRSIKLPVIKDANDILRDEVIKGFEKRGLKRDKIHLNRLKEELELIFHKGFSSYFLILKQTVDEARRRSMEIFGIPNAVGPGRGSAVGSLVCYCLGATNVNPIKHDLLFSRFLSENRDDLPDVDLDFLEEIRDYLKNDWAPKTFGSDYVCNIGSYNTYGLKSALIDMARIFDKDRNEVLALTTKIGPKDDDGKPLTWDKAMEIYPDLKKYCEDNVEIADAAKKLINRNKSMGKHAGGIVISNKPINEFVPLVKGKEGEVVSAWTEGLHDQDLGPMGFVKYDWLVITNLEQINYATKLIKERHGLLSLWAKGGQEDWSDDSFIYDKKAIELADVADLKGIFQFDSDGIRSLVKRGGVNSFDDLVAYAALFRPGPMSEGMHDEYVARKKGEKKYEMHPLIEPILNKTYGVICYQEQCMKILNVVGGIPLKDCEVLRKAISKKKEEAFHKYKLMFIENGTKNLGCSEEETTNWWKQVEAFYGYAFNLSHAVAYTYISWILLVLKAHYPLEFYTAILHFEDDADKIKDYKLDAKKHGIVVSPLDLNKSKVKFDIVDDEIRFGFSNVKGIGVEIAKKIVEYQPYASFTDFLNRFGTNEDVVKPLVGLRMFKEGRPEKLYTYYKWYKKKRVNREARKKRYETRWTNYKTQAEELLGCKFDDIKNVFQIDLAALCEIDLDELLELREDYWESVASYNKKTTAQDEISGFDRFVILPEDEDQPKVDKKLLNLYSSLQDCEDAFYGFVWHHLLLDSPDHEGNRTFDDFKERGKNIDRVEVMINSIAMQTSKKNKDITYWLMKVEDENGEEVQVQVWSDDYERFKDDLKKGSLVKLELKKPDFGFGRYTLFSPPRHQKYLLPKLRKNDLRVLVLRKNLLSGYYR